MDNTAFIKCPKCHSDKAKVQPGKMVYCKLCGYIGPIEEPKKQKIK